MTNEQKRGPELYTPDDFLADLNTAWGGPLYFGITPKYQGPGVNIRPKLEKGLLALAQMTLISKPSATDLVITGDTPADFRRHAISGMPHPEDASDFVHMLADPFCRAFLTEQIEWFFDACIGRRDGVFITESSLPFSFEGRDSVIFDTPLALASFNDYLFLAKSKVPGLSQKLAIDDEARGRFVTEAQGSLDRFAEYARLEEAEKDADLHPIVRTVTDFALAQFHGRPRSSGLII